MQLQNKQQRCRNNTLLPRHRSFVYTFRMSRKCTPVSLSPFIMAFVFCFVNAYNISKFASVHGDLPEEWKHSVTFVVGRRAAIYSLCFCVFVVTGTSSSRHAEGCSLFRKLKTF